MTYLNFIGFVDDVIACYIVDGTPGGCSMGVKFLGNALVLE